MRFLIVIEVVVAPAVVPAPKPGRLPPVLLFPISTSGTAACFAGEPLEMSNGPELELFCLACGQISSLGPGVSGVRIHPSATNKSTGISRKTHKQTNALVILFVLSQG